MLESLPSRGTCYRFAVTGLPADADPALVTVQLGDVPVPAEWICPMRGAVGVTQVGITLPAATPVGDSVPLVVQRRLSNGAIAVSQTVLAAFEAVRQ
jgi:uncharacterized protein (TIGR03437 family)